MLVRSWVEVAKNVWNPDQFPFRGKEADKLSVLIVDFEVNDQEVRLVSGEQITNANRVVVFHWHGNHGIMFSERFFIRVLFSSRRMNVF